VGLFALHLKVSSNPNDADNIGGSMYFTNVTIFIVFITTFAMTYPIENAVFLKEESSKMYSVAS